ncbi:MAG: hypothetical protein LBD49_00430 [Oscillospiraceae bacterium]|nr:hypothetical protein [Oscillospiraceae bacterium]
MRSGGGRFADKCFAAVIIAAAAAVTAYLFADGISGSDYWWHVKTGEWIWLHKRVPETDIFSWYGAARGLGFTAHEWLAELFFYGLQRAAGSAGVFIFSVAGALGLVLLSIKANMKRALRGAVPSAVFFTLFAAMSQMFFYGRPAIFSFYLLFAELCCLYSFAGNPESRALFLVPPIGCLWANLHGGSSNLSYLLCLIFLVCGSVKLEAGRLRAERLSAGRRRALIATAALTAAATLVNPRGAGLFAYPYLNIGDTFMQSVISEWGAPDAKRAGDLIFYFAPACMAAGGMLVSKKEIRLTDFALFALFALMLLRSVRFAMLFYIAMPFFAFGYFPEQGVKELRGKLGKASVALFLALSCAIVAYGAARAVKLAGSGSLISSQVSAEAVLAVKNERPERLFNDYNFGGELIYNDIPVFFDGRADVYAAEGILKDGVSLLYLTAADGGGALDIDALLDKYRFDGFFISESRPLCVYLKARPEKYRLAYSDGEAAYFAAVS